MFKMSEYSFVAGLFSVGLALLCYAIAFASVRLARRQSGLALEGGMTTGSLIGTESVAVTLSFTVNWFQPGAVVHVVDVEVH